MAATMDGACAPASVREQRTKWSSETTQSLIMLWENNLRRLRGTTRNSKVYEAITAELNAGLLPDVEPFTNKQVRLKIDNLNKKYRLDLSGSQSPGAPTLQGSAPSFQTDSDSAEISYSEGSESVVPQGTLGGQQDPFRIEQGNRKRQRRSEGRRPPYTEPSQPPSVSPQPPNRRQRTTPTQHKSFCSTERRRTTTTSPRRSVTAQPTSMDQPPMQVQPNFQAAATWTSQEVLDPPVVYVSTRPWRRQMRVRVGMPEVRLFRPFQGRTVTDVDHRAQQACLPVPACTRFCGRGAELIHPAHERGTLHKQHIRKEAQSPG
ncbi:hypothetical protein HPB50_012782 [Hyalomma asiaticum]|uniref:Uncharacterized protein n=1 Tax=Hyalomma asiaticum TaxID=266040 RepID=A0ACB7SKI6_HYAAI|nr:hypothetical protein HPB50_012782 [Hyalomma asiaticum]